MISFEPCLQSISSICRLVSKSGSKQAQGQTTLVVHRAEKRSNQAGSPVATAQQDCQSLLLNMGLSYKACTLQRRQLFLRCTMLYQQANATHYFSICRYVQSLTCFTYTTRLPGVAAAMHPRQV